MPKLSLEAKKRIVLGHKVKKLRKEGSLPANLYGKNIESQALEVAIKDFQGMFAKVGETGLIDLKFGEETRPVLIHNVQRHPLTNEPLHVDFHQVSLKEKTTATVRVEFVGEAPAVREKIGILIQPLSEVEIEALPQDLPEHLEVIISSLSQVGNTVTVGDIKVDKEKVTIKTSPEEVVAKIDALAKAEEVAPSPPTEGEAVTPVEGGGSQKGEEVKEGETQEKPAEAAEKKEKEEKA